MENGENKIKVEYETFDLKKFIFDIIEKNSNLAMNKNIQILTSIDELPSDFYGDSKLLDHSITNIISNAVKYSKNDTTVRILAKANDKKVALRIIDQGIGIPKEDLANIGQKFFRAKNTLSVAGTGIGIYLTKHFIQLHGGNVAIDSEINVGTTVTITLPRVSKDQL
jgi:signal transduction histidine kinase